MPVSPDLYLAYLATIGVFLAAPPGPSQMLMISSSLTHGLRRSAATVAGDLSANALQMAAAAFGLAALTFAGRALSALRSRPKVPSRISGGMMFAAAGLLAMRAPDVR